jgi:hypothetical protein
MAQFYCYKGLHDLGSEPCGTEGRHIFHNLKTLRGAINRVNKWYKYGHFKIYSFTNFYDDKTFKLVYQK